MKHLSVFFPLGAACLLFLTGCGAATTSTGVDTLNGGGTMQGILHGGNQPISGATIQLYTAGTTGYGSAGTLLATTTTRTTGDGGFAFTQTTGGTPGPTSPVSDRYQCPATGDPQLYILATGGDPGGGTNVNAAGIVAIGKCSAVASSFINVNEVTTVATLAAMQQYFNPNGDTLGSPGPVAPSTTLTQAQTGFANAQSTISVLANIAGGRVNTTYTPASSVAGVTMVATPESTKINLIANIIAACINSVGIQSTTDNYCTTLFANAIPQSSALTSQPSTTFPTATDTVQAVYYMLSNPTQSQDNGATGKLANLFNLASANQIFAPALAAQPLDWTIGIQYRPSANVCTGNSSSAFFNPTLKSIAVDASGNIWLNGGSASANSLVQFSPTGQPLKCLGNAALGTGLGLTIDPSGNVWSASASAIFEAVGGGTTTLNWSASGLSGIVADKSGNIFYIPSTATPIQEFPAASSVTTQANTFASTSVGANITAGTYLYVASDSLGRVLAPGNAAAKYLDLVPATGTGSTNGYALSNITTTAYTANAYGAAVDSSNNVFAANTCCAQDVANRIVKMTIAPPATPGATAVATQISSEKYLGGTVGPRGNAVDGAGNVWWGMGYATASSPATLFALSEVSNDLSTGISPNGTTPSACASGTTTGCLTNGGFQKTGLSTVVGLAIDPSGNVWAAGQTTSTVVEIVGQAVPVQTPLIIAPGTKPL